MQVGATGAKVRIGGVMPDEDRDNAVQVFRQGLLREDAQNSLKMLGENLLAFRDTTGRVFTAANMNKK